jgi:hypothetical protein
MLLGAALHRLIQRLVLFVFFVSNMIQFKNICKKRFTRGPLIFLKNLFTLFFLSPQISDIFFDSEDVASILWCAKSQGGPNVVILQNWDLKKNVGIVCASLEIPVSSLTFQKKTKKKKKRKTSECGPRVAIRAVLLDPYNILFGESLFKKEIVCAGHKIS